MSTTRHPRGRASKAVDPRHRHHVAGGQPGEHAEKLAPVGPRARHLLAVDVPAAALAESGSIDGYVWEVMKEREPELVDKTRIVFRSERLGLPPIVALDTTRDLPAIQALTAALLGMTSDRLGREILSLLAFDGFTTASAALYESTVEKWQVVKAQA
jgi:phosphonate transport system substrate-binding protein